MSNTAPAPATGGGRSPERPSDLAPEHRPTGAGAAAPHLCHIFPSFDPGGAEVRTSTLIDATAGEFRHTIVSLTGSFRCRAWLRGGEDSARFVAAPRPEGRNASPLALARLLRTLRPDLVLTYGWGGTDGVLAARLGGFRRVLHAEDGFGPDEVGGQKLRRVLARRVLLRGARGVVCPSRTLAGIARGSWRVPAGRVRYIPNGIDGARFSPGGPEAVAAARRRLGCSASECLVGSVGQLRGEKNQGRLIRAFAAVAADRPARLLLVGDGPLRGELDRLARDLGVSDRVLFAGAVKDPVECYQAMDVFALSSDTEQMPISVLEAMGVGLPVVGTDVGDVAGMVDPSNRPHVVPSQREDAYEAALATLVDDATSRGAIGRANRARCLREFGLERMVAAYRDLYHDALGVGTR